MTTVPSLLATLPLCDGLDETQRQRLAELLVPVSVNKGDAVFKEGTASKAMYLLARGKVDVRLLSRDKPMATLKAPTVFGEMGVLTSSPHCATIIAASAVEIFALSADRFDELVKNGDMLAFRLALNLARILADRLREVDRQLQGKTAQQGEQFLSVRERLLRDWSY